MKTLVIDNLYHATVHDFAEFYEDGIVWLYDGIGEARCLQERLRAEHGHAHLMCVQFRGRVVETDLALRTWNHVNPCEQAFHPSMLSYSANEYPHDCVLRFHVALAVDGLDAVVMTEPSLRSLVDTALVYAVVNPDACTVRTRHEARTQTTTIAQLGGADHVSR